MVLHNDPVAWEKAAASLNNIPLEKKRICHVLPGLATMTAIHQDGREGLYLITHGYRPERLIGKRNTFFY